MVKVLKEKHSNQEYSTWQSYHLELKKSLKRFPDKEKLKEFITTKLAL